MPEASVSGVEVEVDTDKRIAALADLKVPDITSIYEFGDELGRGRFSVVQAATHKKEGVKYAVKVVENETLGDEENLEALETEIKILRQLSNPHIVQLKEVVTAKENTYIVMELLSGGEARGCASNPCLRCQLMRLPLDPLLRSSSTASSRRAATLRRRPQTSLPRSYSPSTTCTRSTSCTETSSPRTFFLSARTAAT